jgi:hypothetical protein
MVERERNLAQWDLARVEKFFARNRESHRRRVGSGRRVLNVEKIGRGCSWQELSPSNERSPAIGVSILRVAAQGDVDSRRLRTGGDRSFTYALRESPRGALCAPRRCLRRVFSDEVGMKKTPVEASAGVLKAA